MCQWGSPASAFSLTRRRTVTGRGDPAGAARRGRPGARGGRRRYRRGDQAEEGPPGAEGAHVHEIHNGMARTAGVSQVTWRLRAHAPANGVLRGRATRGADVRSPPRRVARRGSSRTVFRDGGDCGPGDTNTPAIVSNAAALRAIPAPGAQLSPGGPPRLLRPV